MVRVLRIELRSQRWQRQIIASIRYTHWQMMRDSNSRGLSSVALETTAIAAMRITCRIGVNLFLF